MEEPCVVSGDRTKAERPTTSFYKHTIAASSEAVLPSIQRQAIADPVIQQLASSLAVRNASFCSTRTFVHAFQFSESSGFGLSPSSVMLELLHVKGNFPSFVCFLLLFLFCLVGWFLFVCVCVCVCGGGGWGWGWGGGDTLVQSECTPL